MRVVRAVVATFVVSIFAAVQAHAENVSDNATDLLQPIMTISTGRLLDAGVVSRIIKVVESSGATADAVRFPTLGLTAYLRDGRDIFRLGGGWRIPTATMIASSSYLRAVGGEDMVNAAGPGNVLMGEGAASLRKARVGDVLVLRDARFRPVNYRIGAIVPDSFVDWGEIFMTTESARPLGRIPVSRIDVTNIKSPSSVVAALRRKNIRLGDQFKLRTSWDLKNPDGTLGTASTKRLLGEFAFRPTVGGSIVVSSDWVSRNISWRKSYSGVALRNNCHKVVAAAIQGALTDIKRAGLASAINVDNSNRSGGCFVGRYNRLGGTFGAPSRHAWGMALDINTDTNTQGEPPNMNCDIVRIFRKWGFAWAGNFWPPDGMHFEYVGERRDLIGYPSRYCRNKVVIPTTTLPQFPMTDTTTTSTTTTSTNS